MHRILAGAFALTFMIGLSGAADATPCRDAKGKFVKCKTVTTQTVKKRCRDAKGHYIKCKTM